MAEILGPPSPPKVFAQLPFQLIEALLFQAEGEKPWRRPFRVQGVGDEMQQAIETDHTRLLPVQENAQSTAKTVVRTTVFAGKNWI